MLKSISKINGMILSLMFLLSFSLQSQASDISAIDFNGDLIGKVVPDGNVINFNNELIGYITPDGYVFDGKDELIGGVVPQGVVISNKNTVLGKVNNDGSVVSMTNSLVGKVLPSGLVVNDNYDVLGSVVSGDNLVYTDKGTVIGRVSGDGYFYDLQGRNNGFVTSTGEVYTFELNSKKPVLSGKIVSSKFIVSSKGKFLGGVASDGKVIDSKNVTIGNIHANGYVYDKKMQVVGSAVNRGYAFDYNGKYLGHISYNGDVINKKKIVAIAVNGARIIDANGKQIGYSIPISATFNTIDGKYLGRLMPNGKVVKAREEIGKIGISGNAINARGDVIGYVNHTGPLFDYLGENIALAGIDGRVISLDGLERGAMLKNKGYDKSGKYIGEVLQTRLIYDNNNNFLGINGISSKLNIGDELYVISPNGYVFNTDKVVGNNYLLSGLYTNSGTFLSYMTTSGNSDNNSINDISKLNSIGILWDKNNKILGKNIGEVFLTDILGKKIGDINPTNLVISKNNIFGKVLPLGYIANYNTNTINSNQNALSSISSVSINGDYIGNILIDGSIIKDNSIIGKIASDKYALDNTGAILGASAPQGVVINKNCEYIGIISQRGEARNYSGAYIGTVLANNQVLNDSQEVIGYVVEPSVVVGEKGDVIGVQNSLGVALDYQNKKIGCQDTLGLIRNSQKEIVGQKITIASIMGFDDKIIGYTNISGSVIDNQGIEVARINTNGNISSKGSSNLGVLFKYTIAFDDNNIYLGRVDINGNVLSDNGAILGKVQHNGKVVKTDGSSGYALFDLYVYDNDHNTVGYISKNGDVYSIMGEMIGSIYEGFVLNKKKELIARGSRDYYIRNNNKEVIGYLNFDGSVVNTKNIKVGQLSQDGNVVNSDDTVLAQADPLQYYRVPAQPDNQDISPDIAESENLEQDNEPASKEEFDVKKEEIKNDEKEPKEEKLEEENIITTKEKKEKTPQETKIENKENKEKIEDIGENITVDKGASNHKGKKSHANHQIIGIAITPGGNYIGDITNTGKVIDQSGQTIGEVDENGTVFDENGNEIGEYQRVQDKLDNQEIDKNFNQITQNVITTPYAPTPDATNVGPGGGIGPGGRYNPLRAQMLDAKFKMRRDVLSGGVISSGGDFKAYTGWQDDWGSVAPNKIISTLRVDMSNVVTADKPIPAVMARSLISLGGAPATAIVERNIYGDSGRNVIIPAGSRIIGGLQDFGTDERFDSTSGGVKIEIKWERIIRPDGIAFDISSAQTGDAQGRGGGALGYVDEQLTKKYGLPLVGTVATSAISYMMAANEDAAANSQVETSKQQAATDARTNFLERMDEILNEIIESKKLIEPVTYVPAGTRIIIYPMADLWLRTTKDVKEGAQSIGGGVAKNVLMDGEPETAEAVSNGNGQNQQAVNNNEPAPSLMDGEPAQYSEQKQNAYTGGLPPPSADGSEIMQIDDEDDLSEMDLSI